MGESLREFLDSFSYGSRNDLSFKFLKRLDEEDGAEFLREILHEIGELYDGAPAQRLIDLVYEKQLEAYAPQPGATATYSYEDAPFTPLLRPLNETTLGLVTSSGHFTTDDPPGDGRSSKSQAEIVDDIDAFIQNTPELSEIPMATGLQLEVRHPGYDIRSASRDPEVALPIQALRRAESRGIIGSLAEMAYSFVGAASQLRLRSDRDGWVDRWKEAGIQALFLVPV